MAQELGRLPHARSEAAQDWPHLAGIVGRRAASAKGYPYTEVFRTLGLTWTPEAILAFIKAPTKVVPGTKMDYVIRFSDEDAAALVRFLEAQPPL